MFDIPISHELSNRASSPRFLCHCRSLTTLASNLSAQNLFRLFGEYANLQFLWRCQKHPFTNTTLRNLGRTMSGQPGRRLTWMRKRNPNLCSRDRTASSGFVSLARILDMFQAPLLCDAVGHNLWYPQWRSVEQVIDNGSYLSCQQRRHGVADLLVLLCSWSREEIVVWEGL